MTSKEIKWKYCDKNLNLFKSKNDNKEFEEMFDFIDESKKKELQNIFEIAINHKYDIYKKYLYENNLFLFKSLEDNIKESVYCLMIGLYVASITNTNLILERAVKLALIQYQSKKILDYKNVEIIDKYIEYDKKISGKSLDVNLQSCLKFKILNKEEYDELRDYKIKYRDGFSHFTPKNILKDEKSYIHYEGSKSPEFNKILSLPIAQAIEVKQFAFNNAEKHLDYILKIINHLQYKVLEKFRVENLIQ